MIIFRKILIIFVALLGIVMLLIGILQMRSPHTVDTTQQSLDIVPHAAVTGNIRIDYTSPIRKIDPLAIGMDVSGYEYPDVFANDLAEQQKLKTLGIQYMRMDLKYSTPGDSTSKIVCAAVGCDTRWTGDQWVQAIKSIGAQPLIIVHYSAFDAANMVKHFNKDTNNYVQYWLVGMNRIWQEYLLRRIARISIKIMMR